MKVYMAICYNGDPESGQTNKEMLGVFDTKKAAKGAFTRKEARTDTDGKTWEAYHTCYEGDHEVVEFEINKWYPMGK